MADAADDVSQPDVLTAALAAWDAGLCVVPVNTDGTKTPQGSWKKWQTERPSRERVHRWFANGHPGVGIICGAVSGNLEMLEFEGRAVHDGTWDLFLQECEAFGFLPVLDRIIEGYAEKSPSDGNHLLYRCDEIDGNRKLARLSITEVLIETRGQGGFVVVAPSHGTTHSTGMPWETVSGSFATIATITPEERAELFRICELFDQLTEEEEAKPLPDAVVASITIGPIAASGESWIGEVVDELAKRSWDDVLGQYGWTRVHDAKGVTYWRRPGKDEGWSATTNAKGTDRLIVFSSATPFVEFTGRGKAPSYDRLDVIATYSHGGDRVAAARALAGRNTPSGVTVLGPVRPANVDPATGEIIKADPLATPLLPEEFWQARSVYQHIRQAARARMIAPDALLGAVLARVALLIDNRFYLPPIVGRYGTLDFLLGLSGRSGSGKGSTLDAAAELLPVRRMTGYRTTTLPIGSGEGMVHAYHKRVMAPDENGKNKPGWERLYDGILFRIDEGQALTALAARSGQTTMTTLRSAWSGEQLGGTYASEDKKVTLAAFSYRFVGVMAIQPELAKDLLADHIGGTPQRFVWLSMLDPDATAKAVPWPGEITLELPAWSSLDSVMVGDRKAQIIPVDEAIADYMREDRASRLRGGGSKDDHSGLRRLKVATILAVLDGELDVRWEHWELAGYIADVSERSVEYMRQAIDAEQERHVQRDVSLAGRRARAAELARAKVADETERAARQIAHHVRKHHDTTSQPCARRCLTQSLRSELRHIYDDGISRCVAMGWVDEDDSGGFIPGHARPA